MRLLQEIISGFKAKTGVDLGQWQGHRKISAAVDVVLRGDDHRRRLDHMRVELERIAKDTKKALAAWPELSLEDPVTLDAVDPVEGRVAG